MLSAPARSAKAYPQGPPGDSRRVLVGALCFPDQLIHAELLLGGCGLPVMSGPLKQLIARRFNALFATPLLLRPQHLFFILSQFTRPGGPNTRRVRSSQEADENTIREGET